MTLCVADPFDAFLISDHRSSAEDFRYSQKISADLTDHRGQAGLSAVAVMAESCGGRRFHRAVPAGSGTVQSTIHLTAGEPVVVGAEVLGTGRLLSSSGTSGATSTEVVDAEGRVVCAALARGVTVGRASEPVHQVGDRRPAQSFPESRLLARVDPDLDGRQVLSALADNTVPMGPLHRLLAMSITTVGEHDLTVSITPQAWTANPLGSLHGGVIASMMTESCSLASELPAAAGQRFRVTDIDISFLRSPPVSGDDLTVVVQIVKSGRRIISMSARMIDSAGTVLTLATANAMQ
jgi:uncharacterized protein (TIGR00369 family)